MNINDIIDEVVKIRLELPDDPANPIDFDLSPVKPYIGDEEIKLIIIGQDPTIRNKQRRKYINTTLNLDKNGALKTYVENICRELDISVQNVYATNIFKYFYSIPPADTPNVLIKHKTQNIELLRKEIECYKDSPIITLGEPVLRLLTNEGEKVRNYWNFQERGYKYLSPDNNILRRYIFPFPHQPSMRKLLYNSNFKDYIKYMKDLL
ncbi:MAG: hypothetical protein E7065_04050 [Lentimicrobiaceae bacterium]|nr:hypothetical protein [Lentimicrobiaceae bacterium]